MAVATAASTASSGSSAGRSNPLRTASSMSAPFRWAGGSFSLSAARRVSASGHSSSSRNRNATTPADQWRGVVAFRFRLEEEWPDAETLRTALREGLPPTHRNGADIEEAVRSGFDLPAELPDEAVEAAVSAAIDALEDGSVEAARQPLAEAVTSVCEREAPTPADVDASHPVACHRYDPSKPGAEPDQRDAGTADR